MPLALALILSLSLALASPSFAAETVGAIAGNPGAQAGGNATYAYTGGYSGWTMGSGVITRWRINVGQRGGAVRLRVVRPQDGGNFLAAGSSARVVAPPNAITTFATRVPVETGDILGLDDFDRVSAYDPDGRGQLTIFEPPMEDGQVRQSSGTFDPRLMLVNADIESDSDRDGFGDETQDACPADATRQSGCGEAAAIPPRGHAQDAGPGLSVRRSSDLRVVRRHGVVLAVTSPVTGVARLRVRVAVPGRRRALVLGPTLRDVRAGAKTVIRVRAGARSVRVLRRALARRRTLQAVAILTVGDQSRRLPVQLRR